MITNLSRQLAQHPEVLLPSVKSRNAEGEIVEIVESISVDQKEEKLQRLIDTDIGIFLERYGKLLNEEQWKDLLNQSNNRDNYELQFYLKKYMPSLSVNNVKKEVKNREESSKTLVKNRRWAHVQRLMQDTSPNGYFSMENMEKRRPYLYYQHVGRYKGEDTPKFEKGDKLYERLLQK
eukprot:TRINITY_DN1976_c0_g1_i4.p1 TRINITY_DN1976_c0_g1~~TRINITY_DN1976_c0_g1_i4.p1  ORF type:complete len:178 (+),score=51.54 TRINITY_DN1976_c0_g1_i4:214-747(+)